MPTFTKPVKSLWWNGANGDATLNADDNRTLTFQSQYRGDRDEEWVVERVDGEEVARHNVRYIASIYFLDREEADDG